MRLIKASQYTCHSIVLTALWTYTHITMEKILKFTILLCCTYTLASEHSHLTIPVEHYETELQNLGEHVEIPETPVKVIKITKTIAVKVPVPYPVKVIEKVPYPVHISKPYPVPVTQIVHVPHVAPHKPHGEHEAIGGSNGLSHNIQYGQSYQVQESPSHGAPATGDHSFESYIGNSDHGNFGAGDEHSAEGTFGNSYDAPNSYYGYSGDKGGNGGSFESKSYDEAIKDYLQKHQPSGNSENSGSYSYH